MITGVSTSDPNSMTVRFLYHLFGWVVLPIDRKRETLEKEKNFVNQKKFFHLFNLNII